MAIKNNCATWWLLIISLVVFLFVVFFPMFTDFSVCGDLKKYVVDNKEFFHAVSLVIGIVVSAVGLILGYHYFIKKLYYDSSKDNFQYLSGIISTIIKYLEDANIDILALQQESNMPFVQQKVHHIRQKYDLAYFLIKTFRVASTEDVKFSYENYYRLNSFVDGEISSKPVANHRDATYSLYHYCFLYTKVLQDLHILEINLHSTSFE